MSVFVRFLLGLCSAYVQSKFGLRFVFHSANVRSTSGRSFVRSFFRSVVRRSFVRPSVRYRAFVSCSKKDFGVEFLGVKKIGVETFDVKDF